MKKTLVVTTLLASCISSAHAQAQPAIKWQIMPEVTFNYPVQTGTKAQKDWAYAVWNKEINSTPQSPVNPKMRLPSFILIGAAETAANSYSFTSFNAAGKCIDPPNGDGTDDAKHTYSICPLKIMKRSKSSGAGKVEMLKDFCYLNDPEDMARNHTEMAFDAKNKVAHFRVIMYGKHVTECNRAVKLD